MRVYGSEGIVLSRWNYGEADRILVLYTKHLGKSSLMAKGVRKPKSRKRGGLEVFTHLRFSASKGKDLDLMTEVEVIDDFGEWRENLKKVALAYFFVEVISKLTREGEKNLDLFFLLLNSLKRLSREKQLKKARKEFTEQALILSGFWPRGKEITDPDKVLENVVERKINSIRVGKKLLT